MTGNYSSKEILLTVSYAMILFSIVVISDFLFLVSLSDIIVPYLKWSLTIPVHSQLTVLAVEILLLMYYFSSVFERVSRWINVYAFRLFPFNISTVYVSIVFMMLNIVAQGYLLFDLFFTINAWLVSQFIIMLIFVFGYNLIFVAKLWR